MQKKIIVFLWGFTVTIVPVVLNLINWYQYYSSNKSNYMLSSLIVILAFLIVMGIIGMLPYSNNTSSKINILKSCLIGFLISIFGLSFIITLLLLNININLIFTLFMLYIVVMIGFIISYIIFKKMYTNV